MIERYTLPEMGRIWSEENKFRTWLKVEIEVCRAYCRRGEIPEEDLRNIEEKANFDVERIKEIEKDVRHDVIAFLTNVAEYVGPSSRFIHKGMTSSDLLDTALSLRLVEASKLIQARLVELLRVVERKSLEYKNLIMMGRTHGVHAEPITFGLKFLIWHDEIERHLQRFELAVEQIRYGKISGAVGTYAHLNPEIERWVCEKLGLKPCPVSNQIIQRDRHCFYLSTLAILASSLDKFCTEIRALQRTEILELEEGFSRGQKGSSAMPHKKNPITCERICGLARLVRANLVAALENINLWGERDISHSSCERVILPDSTILIDYLLTKFTEIIQNLRVYPENMKRNLKLSRGLFFSQRIMLKLVEKGATREDAYIWVQRNAMRCWEEKVDFKNLIKTDPDIKNYLTQREIDDLFDIKYYTRYVDEIIQRIG